MILLAFGLLAAFSSPSLERWAGHPWPARRPENALNVDILVEK